MKTLSNLEFSSLLDVGGAEGYKAYVAREIFGVEVKNCDISEEACKRAEEIFGIDSDPADVHNLPYKDNQFDVLICSEVLEHVTDVRKALHELLRVAGGAIIITVPHEPKKVIESTIRKNLPHGHIHYFVKESFDFLKKKGYHIFSKRIINSLLMFPCVAIQAMPAEYTVGIPKFFVELYNSCLPLLRKIFPDKLASLLIASLIRFDEFICRVLPLYHSILILILKNEGMLCKRKGQGISAYKIINMNVPYHFLQK
jgi:SAM-dependent methyltransferase